MPTPAHNRIIFSGIFGSSTTTAVEIWSWGLKTGPNPLPNDAARASYVASLRAAYTTHIAPMVASSVKLTRTRVSLHAAGGLTLKETDGSYAQADDVTVVPGSNSSTNVMPLQTAAVCSLITPRPGPTGRGRVFLPAVNLMPQGGTFDWAEVLCQERATAMGNLLEAINALDAGTDDVGKVHVVSSKGYMSPVLEVRVGSIPDTMRSRRNARTEVYASSVLSPAP